MCYNNVGIMYTSIHLRFVITFIVSQTESTVETCESIHCATLKALEKVILSVEGVAGKCDSDPKCLTLSCSLTRNGFPTSLIYRLLPGSRGPYAIGIELFVSGNPVINGTFSENTTVPVSLFGFSGTTEIYITQLSDGVIATVSQSFRLWLILSDNNIKSI